MRQTTALITGASSGIGRELARVHAAAGGHLILVARRVKRLEDLKEELERDYRIRVMVIAKDLSRPESPLEIYQEVKMEGLEVDYLINNAGFGGRGVFAEQDPEMLQRMIRVNVTALTALTSLFLPDFINRNSGRIMNVASIAALMPGPLQAVYFASKAYVRSFSDALTEELKATKVTVTTLLPGTVDTEFPVSAEMNETKLFADAWPPAAVAKTAYREMLRGRRSVMTGVSAAYRVLLHLVPLLPVKLVLKIVYRMQA